MSSNATYDTWTLTLRPGVKFNDGSALTSGGGDGQLHRALKASPLTGVALDQVASVGTPDDMTVVYTLTGPNPDVSGRAHHPGRLRGGRGDDPAGHVRPVGPR
jgi:ABC-type transport system substrate-binding protein